MASHNSACTCTMYIPFFSFFDLLRSLPLAMGLERVVNEWNELEDEG